MDSFEGRLAVVTGGGTGMGRELVVQLAAAGASVAACDVQDAALAETLARARGAAPQQVRLTGHHCDVADEAEVERFRDEVLAQHRTDHVHLLFNNAGIAGGGSFVAGDRAEWDRVFAVDWGGVYHCTRAFLPLLIAAPEAHLVNTSSVNGFWASMGPSIPHTAYSTAKFAVKGFTEALITDLRLHAPHVGVSVVMPGHVGTEIVHNTLLLHRQVGGSEAGAGGLSAIREEMARRGIAADGMADDDLVKMVEAAADMFRANAPLSAAQAVEIILDGVRSKRWRILVGDDARALDEAVRADPEGAYDREAPGLRTIPGT
jgi:NAD(P)-dependent dehydrogenase (short-subunit alcohol dehydrogenase family)